MAPSQPDVWDDEDVWIGQASAAERRRRQNRLNQRAYRRRRHLERYSDATRALVSRPPAPVEHFIGLSLVLCPETRAQAAAFVQRALANYHGRQLDTPRVLPVLSRFNALNALANNALVLGIPMEALYSVDGTSPFHGHPPALSSLPPALQPTTLQSATPHHPWIDILPFPGMRDNILRGLAAGRLAGLDLCGALQLHSSIMAGEDETAAVAAASAEDPAPLAVWGDSWDAASWEVSAPFLRQWTELVAGCPEVLAATNHWRTRRGERRIEVVEEEEEEEE